MSEQERCHYSMSEQERCHYCGEMFPKPVEYHHDWEECLRNTTKTEREEVQKRNAL